MLAIVGKIFAPLAEDALRGLGALDQSEQSARLVRMAYEFEWDPVKADQNVRKHGVTFAEAATAFADPLSAIVPDLRHSASEQRYILFGRSEHGRLLAVMHTERGTVVRIISARLADRRERREYEEGTSDE